eukprot:TRINITY_DN18843_c0_g1_i1.p1 TRINITY_DN18843_c0_g1~~TRINITY_DN18843_c0_g1_i1.p1  ORF type:complete len:240 (+),score=34.58 TRINITY_DN18843_c0_g1_i1:78-797(+)
MSGQPKKPVGGAYGIFLAEKRSTFTKACEGQRVWAITTLASASWKALSDAEKLPYQKKYEIVKANFDKNRTAFLAARGDNARGAMALRSGRRSSGGPDLPKKPLGGAYGVFVAQNRARIIQSLPDGHKVTDVSKAAGAQWKALSDGAKQPYEAEYAEKANEYRIALEKYIASPSHRASVPKLTKNEGKKDVVDGGGGEPEAAKVPSPNKRSAVMDGSAAMPTKRVRAPYAFRSKRNVSF